jgi:hypothetical protein
MRQLGKSCDHAESNAVGDHRVEVALGQPVHPVFSASPQGVRRKTGRKHPVREELT